MRILSTLFVIGWALAGMACSGNGSGGDVNRFVAGCDASTNLGKAFCECAAENARDELSADGFAFLTATFYGDEQELAKLRDELSMAEAMDAGMFMVNAYKKCVPDE